MQEKRGPQREACIIMEVKILHKDEETIQFIIKGINATIANTIRRTIITEVPILAVDEVDFLKNDSALYDEIIAHRIGLIPLKTDLQSYEVKEECTCKGKGCAKCQLYLSLKIKGPAIVYASDIQSQDPKVKPVFEKMPITILIAGQKLEFEAVAKLGRGKEHSKFVPGIAYYTEDKEGIIFTIETFGQLRPEEIFNEALNILDKRMDEFDKKIRDSKTGKITKIRKKIKIRK